MHLGHVGPGRKKSTISVAILNLNPKTKRYFICAVEEIKFSIKNCVFFVKNTFGNPYLEGSLLIISFYITSFP